MSAQIFLTSLTATVILLSTGLWATAHLRQRKEYRLHRDEFFTLASALMREDDCPIKLAFVLRQLGATMNSLVVLGILVCVAATRGRFLRPRPESASPFDEAPEWVERRFMNAYMHAILAVSYRSVVFGPFLRKHFCGNHRPEGVTKTVICEVVKYGMRHEPAYLERLADDSLKLKFA